MVRITRHTHFFRAILKRKICFNFQVKETSLFALRKVQMTHFLDCDWFILTKSQKKLNSNNLFHKLHLLAIKSNATLSDMFLVHHLLNVNETKKFIWRKSCMLFMQGIHVYKVSSRVTIIMHATNYNTAHT